MKKAASIDVSVSNNSALSGLAGSDGLVSLVELSGVLEVFYNASLPDCEVCDLLDQLSGAPIGLYVQNNLDDSCTPVPEGCP
jgi:hypothetical protein